LIIEKPHDLFFGGYVRYQRPVISQKMGGQFVK